MSSPAELAYPLLDNGADQRRVSGGKARVPVNRLSKQAEVLQRSYASRLRASRIAAGYETAELFASDIGVEAPRYRKWEREGIVPPIDVLDLMCSLLDKSSDFLLFGRGPASRPDRTSRPT